MFANMKCKQFVLSQFVFVLSVLLYGCEKHPITSDGEQDSRYPTTLYPISQEKIQQLQSEFDSLNNFKICSKINNYGFIGNERYNRVYQNIPISRDDAFLLAVNSLLKNAKYVNIKDSITLLASSHSTYQIDVEGTKWKIIFGPQIYCGFEIPYTWINVWIYGNEPYAITGHWYSEAYFPPKYTFNKEDVQKGIIGEGLIWYDIAGKPQEFVVAEESIGEEIVNAIIPIETENSIELRITWKIPIKFSANFIGWHIYIDVMCGEIVKIVQEFVT
jgi:hypothetical protein